MRTPWGTESTTDDVPGQQQSRIDRFLKALVHEIETGDYARSSLEKLRMRVEAIQRKFKVDPELARTTWNAIEEAFPRRPATPA